MGRTKNSLFVFWVLASLLTISTPRQAQAGAYLDSAHGNSGSGVNRSITGAYGYSQGNCAHCHEQHASLDGLELPPVGGSTPFSLFWTNFNPAATTPPYLDTDNFCFFCHKTVTSSGQSVVNYDYSRTFGCGNFGEDSIYSTINQKSSHNLADVYTFARNKFSWFKDYSNPCNACHNPHLARDNSSNPQSPAFSAISKPTDHFNLWGPGISETMGSQYGTKYEPLFCNSSQSNREPASSLNDIQGRANTPDYVGFCTDCHTNTANIYSTTLGRYLKKINWEIGGDKHGAQLTDSRYPANSNGVPISGGGGLVQGPYQIGLSYDYVLSCLDCHEPHGSNNVMLLRRRVNGNNLAISITTMDESFDDGVIPNDNKDIGYLCLRCHYDDKAACADGIDTSVNCTQDNHWRHVHHRENIGWDTPYCGGTPTPPDTRLTCGGDGALRCHGWSGNGMGIPHCLDCHYHGSVVTITNGTCANDADSTRKTF